MYVYRENHTDPTLSLNILMQFTSINSVHTLQIHFVLMSWHIHMLSYTSHYLLQTLYSAYHCLQVKWIQCLGHEPLEHPFKHMTDYEWWYIATASDRLFSRYSYWVELSKIKIWDVLCRILHAYPHAFWTLHSRRV